jgi:TRAP-type C4-dicarboxylate transport system permease small subunit
MVFIVFLPLGLVERESAHIDVEIVETKFPRPVRKGLGVFRLLLGIVVYGLLTWRTWLEAMKKYDIGTFSYEEGVKIPTWPSYFILPIGTSLMVLILVRKLIKKDTSPETAGPAAQSEYQT